MTKDNLIYVHHILDAIDLINDFVKNKNIVSFMEDKMCHNAVAHQIQIIGEAANQTSSSYRQQHPHIPWQDIIDTRHKIVHDYLDLDLEIIWDIIEKDLPSLQKQIALLVDKQ